MITKLNEFKVIEETSSSSSEAENERWIEPALKRISKLLGFTKMGMELKLYLGVVDLIRVVVISIAKSNNIVNSLKSWVDTEKISGFDVNILRAFIELGCRVGVIQERGNQIKIDEKFLSEEYFTGQELIEHIQSENVSLMKKIQKPEVKNFVFIYLLVCLDNGVNINPDILAAFNINKKWLNIIEDKTYEYELILSDYILELLNVKLDRKIPFSKSEEFYTDLGRKAFESFTRDYFKSTYGNLDSISSIKRVLDVGCGYGDYIDVVSKSANLEKAIGVELQREVYEIVKDRFKDRDNVTILNEDIFNIELDSKSDLILLNYILFYFSEEEKVRLFKKLRNLLSEDGHIMICQYYPGIESIQKNLAVLQEDFKLDKRIGMYFGNMLLYSEVLLNEALDDFKQAERWDVFCEILKKSGLEIAYMTNAEKFYYSYFIMLKKQPGYSNIEETDNLSNLKTS